MAEETGWIHEIGTCVLREACRQACEWRQPFGNELKISVNLSALQFARSDIADEIREVLTETHLDPRAVHFEITETALGQDEATILHNIADIRELGAKLSVDDFGVGYSSLDYLRKFPADILKIDRSFVDEVSDHRAYGVIKAAIEVRHALGMEVVGEGVETRDQLKRLENAGCGYAQGFLFHKPLRSVEVANLLIDEMKCIRQAVSVRAPLRSKRQKRP